MNSATPDMKRRRARNLQLLLGAMACMLVCSCGRIGYIITSLVAGPTNETPPGVYEGENYGGKERIVVRKDGTFSHSFVRNGRVVVTNDGTWLLEKDSASIVFSAADNQNWPDIPPEETVHSYCLALWSGDSCPLSEDSCSLTCFRDFSRKDVDHAANLFFNDDHLNEYWLSKTSEAPE